MDELLLKNEALRQGEVVTRQPVDPAEADRLHQEAPLHDGSMEDRPRDLNGAEVDEPASHLERVGRIELDPVLANMDGIPTAGPQKVGSGSAGSDSYEGGGIGSREIPVEASAFNPALNRQTPGAGIFGRDLGSQNQPGNESSPRQLEPETASQVAYREAPAESVMAPPLDQNANVVERTDGNAEDETSSPHVTESWPTGFRSAKGGDSGGSEAQPAPGLTAGPLFHEGDLGSFRGSWDRVQTSFVDEPREAVRQADALVADVVKRIAEQFSAQRGELEKQWEKGGEVSTEDLRQALKRYRSLFERLLSV